MADQLIGYRYSFGCHMGVSRGPVDEMVEIKVGDRTAWRGSVTDNGVIPIDAYELFGGEEAEGGIQGDLTVMMGGPTQTAPSALASVLSTPMPGFRGMFTLFFNGIMSMRNPYPKAWKFRVRRALQGWDGSVWYPETAVISLVRPLSEGESEGSSETQTIPVAESLSAVIDYPTSLAEPRATLTLTFPVAGATMVSVDRISVECVEDAGDGSQTVRYDIPAPNISFVGNVVTILPTPSFSLQGSLINGRGHVFSVSYTLTLTTEDPLGGLGTTLIKAMNPAHILYEVYTNRHWGRGLAREALDDESWRAAAYKLFVEQYGLCIRWNRKDSIESFAQSIIDHIGATVYNDRSTGKIKIKLIRDDYVRGDIPLYDVNSGLLGVREGTVSAAGFMINEVKVRYRDPVTDEDRVVRATNLAAVQAAGGSINSKTIDYKGLPTEALAARIAKRELRALSPSIRRFNLEFDRRGSEIIPGGLVRIKDPARNVGEVVLRVGSVNYGDNKNGTIKVVAIQDVFGIPARGLALIGPPTGGGSPSTTRPCIGEHQVFELPYRWVYRELSAAEFNLVDADSAYLGAICDEGQALNTSYQLAVKSGAPASDENPPDGSYNCSI
jgi:hypothetical protein